MKITYGDREITNPVAKFVLGYSAIGYEPANKSYFHNLSEGIKFFEQQ